MGVSMSIHIGPFVRIKLEETEYTSQLKICTNDKCSQFGKENVRDAFCSTCGTKIEPTAVTQSGTIGWQEFLPLKDYEYEDELYTPEYLGTEGEEILLSNWSGRCIDDDGAVHSFGEVDDKTLNTMMIVIDMEEFNKRHGTMLAEMKEFFGDKMTIEYGVCSYWS